MQSITITAVIDEKRRIMIDLPEDMPTGAVKITIEPIGDDLLSEPQSRREQMKAILIAAGHLSNAHRSPDAVAVSEAELERLRHIFEGQPPLSDSIIEDREDRL